MKVSSYNIFIESEENNEKCLMANTFSGAVYEMDVCEAEQLRSGDIMSISKEKIKEYYEQGIIVDDEVDERSQLIYWHNKNKYVSNTLTLTILLTHDCNFDCTYCYEGEVKKKLSLDDNIRARIFKFVETMVSMRAEINTVSIILFGGEPLMHFEQNIQWLYDLKGYCEREGKKFVTSIVTNGSLLTEDILKCLKDLNCNSLQLTLDGSRDFHDVRRIYKNKRGTYDIVCKAIEMVCEQENFINPTIRINIDKKNTGSVNKLLFDLDKRNLLGKCFIYFGIIRGEDDEKDYKEEELGEVLSGLWKTLKKNKCNFNVRPIKRPMFCGLYKELSFTITPSGDVYKCWEFVGDKDYKVGELQENGDLYTTPAFFQWQARDIKDIEECYTCKYLPICGGGCASVSKKNSGNIYGQGCLETKGIFEEQVKFYFTNRDLKHVEIDTSDYPNVEWAN